MSTDATSLVKHPVIPGHRKNNFDFLRLLFALSVIVSHSYALSGHGNVDWLSRISSKQTLFSYIGVNGFFVISGYLIFQSLERSKSLGDYFWKRFLRLYPALTVMFILCILLGWWVYENTTADYFSSESTLFYLPRGLTIFYGTSGIDGVFVNNAIPSVMNGSLWTVKYEVTMYLLVAVLFVIKDKKTLLKALLAIALIILFSIRLFFPEANKISLRFLNTDYFTGLALYFAAGSFLAAVRFEKNNRLGIIAIISGALLVLAIATGTFSWVCYFCIPMLTLSIGLSSWKYLNDVGKIGDLSYGLYIYSFPVQQALFYFLKPTDMQMMAYTIVITTFIAFASWHLIEAKALTFKKWNPFRRLQKNY
ncbi:MAG: acyltransferase [Flavobacterium sp.]|uniref:acyltransferase family protein n=1 Tax=Flavobacterium sp. TaxID=239 RepID=UPI0012248202|nr:acyltransferase [Flavobacterium sp.]RZJ65754.1 MAG: acyltransferase [Flavobacterium sp.]